MILSVVIPTFNKERMLARTLAALRAQVLRGDPEWEIVVVDDGSSDGTTVLLDGLTGVAGGPELVVVRPQANLGRARARNRGARAARGRWLLFLDDDIVAPAGLVQAHLELLAASPEYGTIGYAVTDPALVDAPHFHYLDSRGVARLGSGPAPARYFVTQNAAVPREAFLAVGGFDESFAAYGFEDMEVAFRLEGDAGIRFRTLPAPVPLHVHHHSLSEYLAKKVESGRESLPLLASRHPERIEEMRLHHVIDVPGAASVPLQSRLIRILAGSRAHDDLVNLLSRWPVSDGHRPRWRGLYCRLMNLAVLGCFRRGVVAGLPAQPAKRAP